MVVEGSPREPWNVAFEHEHQTFEFPCPPQSGNLTMRRRGVIAMDVVHPQCAGIDVSKRDAKVCVRIASAGRAKAKSTVTTWGSVTNQILALRDHLIAEQVTLVVMEATSSYRKPLFYLSEDGPFEVLLVNARHVKNVPGRKTDVSDATWLAQLGAHGLVRGSFVPPQPVRQIRDLTRTAPSWRDSGAARSNDWRSCSKSPASGCRRWPRTSPECRDGPCWSC